MSKRKINRLNRFMGGFYTDFLRQVSTGINVPSRYANTFKIKGIVKLFSVLGVKWC